MDGTRFVRHEIQVLIALYAIHFSLWIPIVFRWLPWNLLAKLVVVSLPVATCHLMAIFWVRWDFQRKKSRVLETPRSIGHLLVLFFTIASPLLASLLSIAFSQ